MADPGKPSPTEEVKARSQYLRGTIAEELHEPAETFDKDNANLLKFHGTYQQDDRDARGANRAAGGGKSYMFMVRSRVPGGKLTSRQMLAQLDLCDELGNNTLRITTRQGLQLHGIAKERLWETIHRINEVQLTTLAACGDVERNVMCCPAPHRHDPVHDELQGLADRLAEALAPRTRAYHEIWIRDPDSGEDQLVAGGANGHHHEVEPLYGPTYLPRKFKTAIGLPGDNCVDLHTHDLGFLAICRDWRVVGYNVLVGGGLGVTPSAAKTFPALAQPMAFIAPEQAVELAAAVIRVQRDHGNRSDRKVARLKYLLHDRGLAWFKSEVERGLGRELADPLPDEVYAFDDHLGWHEQGDGRWFYGLNVENGRIKDADDFQLKTALRHICNRWRPNLRLTPHQSLLFCDVAEGDREAIEGALRDHGVPLSSDISEVRRWSMACVAWPTCGLAITESERALPGIVDQLEVELARLGLSREVFTLRMTGCPNGCARPYNSDIGLVGKTAGKYSVFLGGRLLGDRLNFLYRDLVPAEEVVPTLAAVFAYFRAERQAGETLGDFCCRKGRDELLAWTDHYAAASVS